MRDFDAVVVGAGPAGLSAAAELSARGSCCLIERGPVAVSRRRDLPCDLLSGVGGAGLFSDGKHSFFPSASALWTLADRAALERAFSRVAARLSRSGIDAGSLPSGPPAGIESGAWREKDYRALYLSLPERLRSIEALWSESRERRSGARVIGAGRAGREIVLEVERDGRAEEVRAGSLVVATGRWSPRWTREWLEALGVTFTFRRVEFGVRLETDAGSPLFAKLPGVDGKLRYLERAPSEPELEFRTFCTCRDGEVVLGEADGTCGFSGRADGPMTGRSNVGLVVRTTDESLGREVSLSLRGARPASLDLGEWLERGALALEPAFGAPGARALWRALERFLEWCPALKGERVRVHAPCIEGVGDYPADDGSLRVADGVWIAGDAGGRFRGIVAAMVSGGYAADRIIQEAVSISNHRSM